MTDNSLGGDCAVCPQEVSIALRDGTRLAALLYTPPAEGAARPVICSMTPYGAGHGQAWGEYLAARGFAFLSVDVRGCGGSEGEFFPGRDAGSDGADIVEWIAKQPQCDGRVMMLGGSYGGWCQWATAVKAPAPLCGIIPTAAACFGVDFPYRSNLLAPYILYWLMLTTRGRVKSPALTDIKIWDSWLAAHYRAGAAFADLDAHMGFPSPIFQEWVAHPDADYWAAYEPAPDAYAGIRCPVLTITGAYDADQPGALAHYRRHLEARPDDHHHLVIGPWDHVGTAKPQARFKGIEVGEASLVDVRQLHCDWYRWILGDGDKPALLRDRVAYYVQGIERWRHAPTLDAVTQDIRTMYLASDGHASDIFRSGRLDETACSGPPDRYRFDPMDYARYETDALGEMYDLTDQRLAFSPGADHLVYHSAPFAGDVEVAGFFSAELWLTISRPDADFHVGIFEIDAAGRAVMLTEDWLRARYRGGPEPSLAVPGEPALYRFERFLFVAKQIRAGSRIRLVVSNPNSRTHQRNYGGGGPVSSETGAVSEFLDVALLHDDAHPSLLRMPIGGTGEEASSSSVERDINAI